MVDYGDTYEAILADNRQMREYIKQLEKRLAEAWTPVEQGWHESNYELHSLYVQDDIFTFHDSETGYERTWLMPEHYRLCRRTAPTGGQGGS